MKQHFILLLIFLFFTVCAFSQTVEGYVKDAATDEVLTGTSVYYKDKGDMVAVLTDVKGYYKINVPDGGTILYYSYLGYEPETHPLVVRKGQTLQLDMYLKVQTELMKEVVVSAGRFDQKLSEITVSMEVLKADQIAKQNATDLSVVLNTLPGVDVTDKQPSIRGGSGWTYGVGSRSLVLVDGMSILTPAVGEINWNLIPMENVEQVEVLKGASSVLYGSSALNGLINVRTSRPGLTPKTRLNMFQGTYMDPKNESYVWWDKNFWQEGKFPVVPLFRRNLLSGIRNPIYTGVDVSHTRRIGDFDVSAGLDLYTDEGYRQDNFNQRVRIGGNLTYHDPNVEGLSYGLNANILSNKYSGFFIWRSANEPYMQSPMSNMGREGNMFYVDPFLNYFNSEKNTVHRLKGRYFYKSDQIVSNPTDKSLADILGNMGYDYTKTSELAGIIQDPQSILPAFTPYLNPLDISGLVKGVESLGKYYFPKATAPDIVDLMSFITNRMPIPDDPTEMISWINNAVDPAPKTSPADHTYSAYLDYQFSKKWNDIQFTTGTTYEHTANQSAVTGDHASDNIALFFQYDQKLFDKLNVSAGMRLEYYRVDSLYKEAETDIFGLDMPFKPVFRAGLNYELAEYTFLRASFGQGYRYPSITEKFVYKDIGGVAAYPNKDLKPESGFNAELGIKQGYKVGNFMGYLDVAGFYTYYKDMIEFQFGAFNTTTFDYIDNIGEMVGDILVGQIPGLGTRFANVSRAKIYGLDMSVMGMWKISPSTQMTYNVGYTYIEPIDADWKETQEDEAAHPDKIKEKSNDSKYLKYRQKHTVKGVFDFQWNRLTVGTNLTYKSKTLAVDYFMVDERTTQPSFSDEVMDVVRSIIFPGLHDYWEAHNTGYFAMDGRIGVEVTKKIQFWVMMNNLWNKEYTLRPMDVSAPRTLILQMNAKF